MDVPQDWPFQLSEPANEDEQRPSPQDETACEQPDEHPPAVALLHPLLIPQTHAPPQEVELPLQGDSIPESAQELLAGPDTS